MAIEITEFSEVLIELTGGKTPVITLKQVAFIMGVDYQTAWGYRQGNSEPRWSDVVRLSHYLIKEHGYYKLGMQPTMVCMGGHANGKVNDDLLLLYEAGTDLHRAFPHDATGYWNALGRMKEQIEDLTAEGERLKK